MPPLLMFRISRDNPVYYLTSVGHNRLPIFRTDAIKQIVCAAYDEARRSGGIMIFAYVIIPDHMHLLTDNPRPNKEVLRYMNGITAKRVIDYLKENNYESSLQKLRIQERADHHKHAVYEHHPNAVRITGEDAMMQKVNYVHLIRFEPALFRIRAITYIPAPAGGTKSLSKTSRFGSTTRK